MMKDPIHENHTKHGKRLAASYDARGSSLSGLRDWISDMESSVETLEELLEDILGAQKRTE